MVLFLSTSSVFYVPYISKALDPSEDARECKSSLFVSRFQDPPEGLYGLWFNLPGHAFIFLLTCRSINIHISVLTYDDEMLCPLSKQSKPQKTLMT